MTPAAAGREAVHLDEYWLSVCSRSEFHVRPAARADGVELVDEQDRGLGLACLVKQARMRAAPRPANISTNDEADCEKKLGAGLVRHRLARSVLPVPGGRGAGMPLGTLAPRRWKRLGSAGSRRPPAARTSPRRRPRCPPSRSQVGLGLDLHGFVRGMSFSVRHRT